MADHPDDRKYTKDHEWARNEGQRVRVGITAYAVEQLGDVTLVDLPQPGTRLRAGAHFGDIESVKAVSELFAPVSGTVTAVNEDLNTAPEKINSDAHGAWMIKITVKDPGELASLLSADAYQKFVSEEAH